MCNSVCVYSSILCVYLVHPRILCFLERIIRKKINTLQCSFAAWRSPRFSFLQGSLVDNFESFLHGSLKHPAPTRTKPQLSTGIVNSRMPLSSPLPSPPSFTSFTLLRTLPPFGFPSSIQLLA